MAMGELGSKVSKLRYRDSGKDDYEYSQFDGNSFHALGMEGNLLHQMKEYDEAIEYYDRALEIDGKDVELLCAKGNALCESERYEKAYECYLKALKIDEKFLDTQIGCGVVLYFLDRFKESKKHLETALEEEPDNSVVLYILRIISAYEKAGQISSTNHDG